MNLLHIRFFFLFSPPFLVRQIFKNAPLSLNCHKTRVGLQGTGDNRQAGKKKKKKRQSAFLKSGKENGLNGFV